MKLFPSLLAADPLTIGEQIKSLEPYCDGFHIDVMDDHFVSNIGFGPSFFNAVRANTKTSLTVHLMVEEPEKWIDRLALDPPDRFVFHWEATGKTRAKSLVNKIRDKGWNVGLAIKPLTSVSEIEGMLSEVDLVVLMGVEPGFSGQQFIDNVAYKISELDSLRKKLDLSFVIAVDGGVNKSNIADLLRLGAGFFPVGSAVFESPNFVEALEELYAVEERIVG
ncbi:ribulose-phosphate 3-epimerase [Candidatus Babeliales bacterium]|nr:ribulose-phosphate 3-epimerase [Candidatus Babeliales bacterium]